eukprot:543033-Amphidinium_carterae.1
MTIISEGSPVGAKQANGLAEGAVRDVKAQVRTLRAAVQQIHQVEISMRHACLPWMIRYSAMCLSRGQVGRDGLTPHRRLRGKDYKRAPPPFSECVQWRKMGTEAEASRPESRCSLVIFLGTAERSNDLVVGTESREDALAPLFSCKQWALDESNLTTKFVYAVCETMQQQPEFCAIQIDLEN